ncbi:MAG: hypothetical protein IJR45_05375, partial [Firmicutes bacterium]|nr:hypothetical protein [Bacillota bacterium]
VIADHGRPPFELTMNDNTEIKSPIMTMLAIKPAGASRGIFTADAQSELSNADFAASVLEYAGIKNDSYGMSYNDIIKNNIHRERTLQTQDVESGTDIRKTAKYSITGNARDFNNWKVINDD